MRKEFLDRLASRLEVGAREYGNASMRRPMTDLIREVLDEYLDVAGWSYIQWVKAREALERAAARLGEALDEDDGN
jgi:hypothetical protein